MSTERSFPVWKTVKLGVCKNAVEYRKRLEEKGFFIDVLSASLASDLGQPRPYHPLDDISCLQEVTSVDLVKVMAKELGLNSPTSYKDFCAKGVEVGLRLCPAEVAPALRLIYTKQGHPDRFLWIAMETIILEASRAGGQMEVVFVLLKYGTRGELWIQWFCVDPRVAVFRPKDSLVFVSPR